MVSRLRVISKGQIKADVDLCQKAAIKAECCGYKLVFFKNLMQGKALDMSKIYTVVDL